MVEEREWNRGKAENKQATEMEARKGWKEKVESRNGKKERDGKAGKGEGE